MNAALASSYRAWTSAMPPFTASRRPFFTAGRAELSRSPHNESSSARAHHSNPVCPALATRSAAHPIQYLDTGVPLSEPSGSSLPLYMHHVVRPRSLPVISRPRSSHGNIDTVWSATAAAVSLLPAQLCGTNCRPQ